MSRPLGSLLVWATLGLGCTVAEPPAIPLYPNSQTVRLPPDKVASVDGPIEKIDGQEVTGQGGRFELLPGCHVVDLDRQAGSNNMSLSSGVYLTGQLQAITYALRMKPGGRYTIRRDTSSGEMQTVRIIVSAREELPGGAVTNLEPAGSAGDIQACKAWEATLAH